jgi:hypothetical protein
LPLDEAKISQITDYLISGENHQCHAPQLKGNRPTHTCRGGRNLTLRAWAAAGIIDAPTDEALERAMRARGIEPAWETGKGKLGQYIVPHD